ncbi:MAG: prolyl oligopeptidase family serine peptidase [Acidisphaera sp.]|nr:prolyl oligopeptidase family serine peptidase [Acidisphaera sp.]
MAALDGPRRAPRSGGPARQLVVLCHGLGADGNALIDLAPVLAQGLPDAAFVFPHAAEPYEETPEFGRQWFSMADHTPAVLEAGVRRAAPLLGQFIDAELVRLNLSATDCALLGFSQGAMMVLHAGLRHGTPLGAVLAFSGALLGTAGLEREITGHTPVLLVHGELDDVVPIDRSRDAERALRAAGVPVESLWCPGLDHSIDEAGMTAAIGFLRRAFAV